MQITTPQFLKNFSQEQKDKIKLVIVPDCPTNDIQHITFNLPNIETVIVGSLERHGITDGINFFTVENFPMSIKEFKVYIQDGFINYRLPYGTIEKITPRGKKQLDPYDDINFIKKANVNHQMIKNYITEITQSIQDFYKYNDDETLMILRPYNDMSGIFRSMTNKTIINFDIKKFRSYHIGYAKSWKYENWSYGNCDEFRGRIGKLLFDICYDNNDNDDE
jgi:hypothetical protein